MRTLTKIVGTIAAIAVVVWSARDRFVQVPTTGEREIRPFRMGGSTAPVTDITGIGPTYAERLASLGIGDASALATSDPKMVSREVGVSLERARLWTERARELR